MELGQWASREGKVGRQDFETRGLWNRATRHVISPTTVAFSISLQFPTVYLAILNEQKLRLIKTLKASLYN
jgi:hypothetical protein